MLRSATASLLGLSLLLCGCEVGPDYAAPKAATEATFGNAFGPATTQPSSLTASPVAAASWWETLNDAELNSLMTRVVTTNLDVKVAQSRVRQARAELAYASGGQYPTVNVDSSYNYDRLSKTAAPYNAFNVPGFPWEYSQYQAGFDASWELDIFGGIRRGVEAATADAAASDADRQGVLLSVMAELARTYVDLRGYQRQYEIAEGNLKSQQETLEVTQDRRKQGVITDLDVAQAQSQVAKTSARLPLLRRQQMAAIHRIGVLLGQTPESLIDELSPFKPLPVPPTDIAIGLPAELLRRRPDVRESERQFAAATARIGEATSDLYPKFSLGGNFFFLSEHSNELLSWRSRSYGLGPSVSFPLFDAGRLRRVVDIRSAAQEAALAQYQRTVLGALEETHNAIVSFVTEQERHASLVEEVKADQATADISEGQYKQGVVDFLNVLDAQRSLYDSEDQLADSDRAVTTSLVALYKALGGGWNIAPPAKDAKAALNSEQSYVANNRS